jgi:hypothetical protein
MADRTVLSPQSGAVAFAVARGRLSYWEGVLVAARGANDKSLMRVAVAFIRDYAQIVAGEEQQTRATSQSPHRGGTVTDLLTDSQK